MALLLRVVIAMCIAGAAMALHEVDTVLPETSEPPGDASAEFGMDDALSLVQKIGDDKACLTLATAGKQSVLKSVKENQALFDGLKSGSECKLAGIREVHEAEAKILHSERWAGIWKRRVKAKKAQKVSYTIEELMSAESGDTGVLWSNKDFNLRKQQVVIWEGYVVKYETKLKDYKKVLVAATANAKKLKADCLCDAQKKHAVLWKAYKPTLSANDALWKKSHKIECAVNSNANCQIKPMPAVKDKALIKDAKNAKCPATTRSVPNKNCDEKHTRTNGDFKKAIRAWNTNPKVAEKQYGHIKDWCTGKVTKMNYLFMGTTFNEDISRWDTSKVTEFDSVFQENKAFNQDISGWDTSACTSMDNMFRDSSFNGDISKWDVSKVRLFGYMFAGNKAFNQDIGGWDTGAATYMGGMFKNGIFNQDIGDWNTKHVTDMDQMFENNKDFNQDISGWDTSKVTPGGGFYAMFAGARLKKEFRPKQK